MNGENNGGIIANNETGDSRSEDNDKNVSRGSDGENRASRTQTFDTGAESKVESEWGKAKKPFQGGTAQTVEGSRRRFVLKLNEGIQHRGQYPVLLCISITNLLQLLTVNGRDDIINL